MIVMKLNDVNMNVRNIFYFTIWISLFHIIIIIIIILYYSIINIIIIIIIIIILQYMIILNIICSVFVCVEPRKMVWDRDFVFNCSE